MVGESSEDERGERAAEEVDECWMVGRDDGDGGVDGSAAKGGRGKVRSNEAIGELSVDERGERAAEETVEQ